MVQRTRLSLLLLVASSAIALLGSCGVRVGGTPISLDDPLGVLQDADEVRLFLFRAETHVCIGDSIAPLPPLDAPVGSIEASVVDLLLVVNGAVITQEVSVAPGSYVAYVRAKGTDSFSMIPNSLIGQGCQEIDSLAANESRGIALRLVPVYSPGDCSDARLSPDEQCTTPGVDDCNAQCQTTPYRINTTNTGDAQESPRAAARGSHRMLVSFVSARRDVGLRVLGSDARPLSAPALLMEDRTLNQTLEGAGFDGLARSVAAASPAVAADGRLAVAATVIRGGDFDVRVGFFNDGLAPEANFVALTSDTGEQSQATGAFASDGSYLTAFVDGSLGVAVRAFAPGSSAPSGSAATSIATSGAAPAVAGLSSGFVVAWTASGRVMLRRLDASGAPLGDAFPAFEQASTQAEPAVVGLPSGGFMVVARDSDVDGAGAGLRGRVFDASGAGGESFQVNSTAAGDQSRPSIAAMDDRVAVVFESAGSIRARVLDLEGSPRLNRERTPSLDDFPIAPSGKEPSVAAAGSGTSALWVYTYQAASGSDSADIFARRIPR